MQNKCIVTLEMALRNLGLSWDSDPAEASHKIAELYDLGRKSAEGYSDRDRRAYALTPVGKMAKAYFG